MKPVANPANLSDAELEHQLRGSRTLEDAPEHVIQRAFTVWQPRRQTAASASLLNRVVGMLTFDSGTASPLAFGARSSGGPTRQVLFSADAHDIDVRISPAAEVTSAHWVISGQVLGPETQGRVSVVDLQGQAVGESALTELGEFALGAVMAGQYVLTLHLGNTDIVLPALDVSRTP
jgi:hypothetical protein